MTISLTEIRTILADAADGSYQRDILTGSAALSGADLRGNARKWSSKYAASRRAALDSGQKAVAAHGWRLTERRADHGRRVLVLVSPSGEQSDV